MSGQKLTKQEMEGISFDAEMAHETKRIGGSGNIPHSLMCDGVKWKLDQKKASGFFVGWCRSGGKHLAGSNG